MLEGLDSSAKAPPAHTPAHPLLPALAHSMSGRHSPLSIRHTHQAHSLKPRVAVHAPPLLTESHRTQTE